MTYPVPDNEQRKRLFRLIVQYSSWTAWNVVGRYHKSFVDLVETAYADTQRHPPAGGKPLLDANGVAFFQNSWASFEGALDKLHRGDKSVFKFIDFGVEGAPYFCEAYRAIHTWIEGYLGGLFYARGIDAPMDRHPLFPKIEASLRDLDVVWCNVALSLQSRHTDLPAPIRAPEETIGNSSPLNCNLDYRFIPDAAELPEVPAPGEELSVRSGQECPCSGVWEPVKMDRLTGSSFLLARRPAIHTLPQLDGCMNYLHQGSPTPNIAFDGDSSRGEGRPTVWRLLWKDDRYRDGAMPDVESSYRFDLPKHIAETRESSPSQSQGGELAFRVSGQTATHGGVWASQDDLHARVVLKKGEVLPVRSDGYGTSWVFVPGG